MGGQAINPPQHQHVNSPYCIMRVTFLAGCGGARSRQMNKSLHRCGYLPNIPRHAASSRQHRATARGSNLLIEDGTGHRFTASANQQIAHLYGLQLARLLVSCEHALAG
jgi:hypothetical protein